MGAWRLERLISYLTGPGIKPRISDEASTWVATVDMVICEARIEVFAVVVVLLLSDEGQFYE